MGGGAAWLRGTGAASAQHWRDFEEIPHIQGQRRSPSRTVGGAKSRLRIKPHTCQRRSEGSNKAVHQDPETPQRLSAEEVRVSSGLPQGQGLWVQQTWVWHKPSWSVQESPVEVWFGGGLLRGWGQSGAVPAWGHLKEETSYLLLNLLWWLVWQHHGPL